VGASAVLGMRVPKWASVLAAVPFNLKVSGMISGLRIQEIQVLWASLSAFIKIVKFIKSKSVQIVKFIKIAKSKPIQIVKFIKFIEFV